MDKFMIVKTTVICSKLIVACTFIILCCTVSIFHKISYKWWLLWFQKYISQIHSPGVDDAKVLYENEGYKKLLIDVQHAVLAVTAMGMPFRANFTAHAHYYGVFLCCCTCILAWDPLSLEASRIFNSLVPDHTTPTYARWKYDWLFTIRRRSRCHGNHVCAIPKRFWFDFAGGVATLWSDLF